MSGTAPLSQKYLLSWIRRESLRSYIGSLNFRIPLSDTGQAVFLLLVVWVILCRPWVLEGLTVPWDSKTEFYPSLYFVVESLRSGDMPW